MPPPPLNSADQHAPGLLRRFSVPLTLLALAAVLAAQPLRVAPPVGRAASLAAEVTDTSPIRHPKFKPEMEVAGRAVTCGECHKALLSLPTVVDKAGPQHANIVLQHGRNTNCFNCHNHANLDTFADNWGREIPFDQPPLVCGKCHGPVYRDWLHGSHGRVNGYWRAALAPSDVPVPQLRRRCVECHDPHHPPFPLLRPAPPPVTLRMGDQRREGEEGKVRDPLRVFRREVGGGEESKR